MLAFMGICWHMSRVNPARVWKMTDSSREFIDQMLEAIVGIEIEITKLAGKWKLGQNKEERDRVNVVEELRRRGDDAISDAMSSAAPAR
jgi:transcriptional regulator